MSIRAARASALTGVGLIVAGMVQLPAGADTVSEVKANPVTLRGATTYSISDTAQTTMIDNLFDAPAQSKFNVSRVGDGLARQRLVEAVADGKLSGTDERYAISAVPFTDAEKAALATAKATLIRVPVHAVGLGVYASGPQVSLDTKPGFHTVDIAFDEGLQDYAPVGAGPDDLLDGKAPGVDANLMKLPWPDALAAMTSTLDWQTPSVMQAWGYVFDPATGGYVKNGHTLVKEGRGTTRGGARFEPTAESLYLQQAFSERAPTQWSKSTTPPPVPGEMWQPFAGTKSRGLDGLQTLLAAPWIAPSGETTPTGTVAAMPTWGLAGARAQALAGQTLQLWVAELQNKTNEWVAPSSESITKAIAAGGEEPLYALHNAVPGGYPLTWVESMYIPSKGLTIDEVNGLAAYARYLVTDGQDVMKADGDGVLSAALVTAALDAVNQAVTSNCTAASGTPVTQKASPYYPAASATPKLAALAAQVQCATTSVAPVVATTTTVAATTTTVAATTTRAPAPVAPVTAARPAATPAAAPRTSPTAPSATVTTVGPTSTAAPTTTTTGTTAAPSPPATSPPTAVKLRVVLPLGLPDDGTFGFDRLTTMVLGAVLLLLGKRSFLRRGWSS